jgi:hypothetical protein
LAVLSTSEEWATQPRLLCIRAASSSSKAANSTSTAQTMPHNTMIRRESDPAKENSVILIHRIGRDGGGMP